MNVIRITKNLKDVGMDDMTKIELWSMNTVGNRLDWKLWEQNKFFCDKLAQKR